MSNETQEKPKHTPGPWTVRMSSTCSGAWPEIIPVSADEDDEELARVRTAFVFDHERIGAGVLAVTYNERPDCFVPTGDHDEVMANARLMAAAPDLLAERDMLRSLLRRARRYMGSGLAESELDGWERLSSEIDAAIGGV